MDVLALASVITAGLAVVSTATTGIYNTRRTAKTAQEGRAEQRAADGYLKVLSLVEQEAQWLDSVVYNLDLDRKELEWGRRRVPASPEAGCDRSSDGCGSDRSACIRAGTGEPRDVAGSS